MQAEVTESIQNTWASFPVHLTLYNTSSSILVTSRLYSSQPLFAQYMHLQGHEPDSWMSLHLSAEPSSWLGCAAGILPWEMWSRGSWGGGKGTAVPLSTEGSPWSTTTSQALEWCFQPQLHFWPTSVSQGLYEDSKLLREESKLKYTAPSHKAWTLAFIFHLLSKATCVWTWQTQEWLAWSCWKLLTSPCINKWVWEISVGLYGMGTRAISMGFQGDERKFTSSGE